VQLRRQTLNLRPLVAGLVVAVIVASTLLPVVIEPQAEASGNPVLTGGPGEYYALTFYGPVLNNIAALKTAWNDYYAESDFQTFKSEFGWNLIRIGFCFNDLASYTDDVTCPSAAINAHSDSGSFPDLLWLGTVVHMAQEQGLYVDLTDFDFTGQAPTSGAMSLWLSDLSALATYFDGNSTVQIYQFGNELEHSTTTNGNLTAAISAISKADPRAHPAMWQYSPSTNTGASSYPSTPSFSVPAGVWQAYHAPTYANGGASCISDSSLSAAITSAQDFAKVNGIPSYYGEIDAQYSNCNNNTEYLISQLINAGIPYILWGYNEDRSNWDTILDAIPVITVTSSWTSTTTTTATSTITVPSTSTATSTTTVTSTIIATSTSIESTTIFTTTGTPATTTTMTSASVTTVSSTNPGGAEVCMVGNFTLAAFVLQLLVALAVITAAVIITRVPDESVGDDFVVILNVGLIAELVAAIITCALAAIC